MRAFLLRGEAGTGKRLVARHLHRLSDRAAGPFWSGWFELAQQGTLFLDEIGAMPLPRQ